MSRRLTFTEYETLLDTDGQSIIDIAEHLIYWRKARLIDAISLKCIYVPVRSPRPGRVVKMCGWTCLDCTAQLMHVNLYHRLAEWTRDFAVAFPELPPLPALLATLSSPQPFETLVPPGSHFRPIYLDALTWLLQHGLIDQLRVYMNVVATPEIKRTAYEHEQASRIRPRNRIATDKDGADADEDDRNKNAESGVSDGIDDSNITISSGQTDSGSGGNSRPRSPASRSFPSISRKWSGRHSSSSGTRQPVTSLHSPAIIANPIELSNEEELWLAEIIARVQKEKGKGSTVTFNRYLTSPKSYRKIY